MNDQPLRVSIEDDELVLRIGLGTFKFAVENDGSFQIYDESTGEWTGPRVTDLVVFVGEVVHAMNSEAEDGSTPTHLFLDSMVQSAIDDGALGIEVPIMVNGVVRWE